MDQSVIELAIEALERRKEAIQSEIDALRGSKKEGPRPSRWSTAARKAQAERMKAYWAKKQGTAKAARASKTAKPLAPKKPGPQSAAAKKAISERMKAFWAKRKAADAKATTAKLKSTKSPK